MKIHSKHLKLILAASLMVQMGCNGNNARRNGLLYNQYGAYPNQQAGFVRAGNAFGQPGYQPGMQPGMQQQNPLLSGIFNGVNLLDEDHDRVLDGNDACTGTPMGTPVDSRGCPTKGTSSSSSSSRTSSNSSQANDETFKVMIPKEPKWKEDCKNQPDITEDDVVRTAPDKDKDGISDKCEIALQKLDGYKGLHPNIFNGAMIAGKQFYSEGDGLFNSKNAQDSNKSILLTDAEEKVWKNAKALNKLSSDARSKFNRQSTKKFLALTYGGDDAIAISKFMAITQPDAEKDAKTGVAKFKAYFDISPNNTIESRSKQVPELLNLLKDKPQYGLAKNDYYEMIPYGIGEGNKSVASLTAIKDKTQSLSNGYQFVYAAETNLVIPVDLDGIELRVGYLVNDKTSARAGSKAGMFFVINDGETNIVTTDLVTNELTGGLLEKTQALLPAPTNCLSSHLIIAYFADSKKVAAETAAAMFSENIFYNDKVDGWKPIPQEWMRLKPLDKSATETCNVTKEQIVFQDAANYLSGGTAVVADDQKPVSADEAAVVQFEKDAKNYGSMTDSQKDAFNKSANLLYGNPALSKDLKDRVDAVRKDLLNNWLESFGS